MGLNLDVRMSLQRVIDRSRSMAPPAVAPCGVEVIDALCRERARHDAAELAQIGGAATSLLELLVEADAERNTALLTDIVGERASLLARLEQLRQRTLMGAPAALADAHLELEGAPGAVRLLAGFYEGWAASRGFSPSTSGGAMHIDGSGVFGLLAGESGTHVFGPDEVLVRAAARAGESRWSPPVRDARVRTYARAGEDFRLEEAGRTPLVMTADQLRFGGLEAVLARRLQTG